LSGWHLVEEKSIFPAASGEHTEYLPGSSYPFFAGSKFTLTTNGFFMKSYGVPIKSDSIPNGIQAARQLYAGRPTGSIRIRWNGDTLAQVQGQTIYLGKMVGLGQEIFPGTKMNRSLENPSNRLWGGPQSPMDIGERWIVPLSVNERPHLIRKSGGKDGLRNRTLTKHPKITQKRIDYNWKGGRVYFTFNGHVVAPIDYYHIGSRCDVMGDLTELNNTAPTSAKLVNERLSRARPPAPPFPWIVIGKICGKDGDWGYMGETGPQPDLSGPLFDDLGLID
jgi:hypothetical protein